MSDRINILHVKAQNKLMCCLKKNNNNNLLSVETGKRTSLVAQMVKNLPVMQETQVRSLGQEDPLEKEMASRSSILSWEIPWTEEPDRQ